MSGARTLTTSEVARLAHVGTQAVCGWVRGGELAAVQVAGVWLFDGDDVDAFLARPRASGNVGPRVPSGPLLRQIELRGGDYWVDVRCGSSDKRALERARDEGSLTLWAADRLAVRLLGLNSWELWGDTVAA